MNWLVTGGCGFIGRRLIASLIKNGGNRVRVLDNLSVGKHVGLCEDSPAQAIATSIQGTQNVIDAAQENGVERMIFTSSDKAVNPTNVMGTSKLMGERPMTAAAETVTNGRAVRAGNAGTIFASTRFGNVLGSRGSVVPLFGARSRRAALTSYFAEKEVLG